jgi:hypothetical protein
MANHSIRAGGPEDDDSLTDKNEDRMREGEDVRGVGDDEESDEFEDDEEMDEEEEDEGTF